MMSLDYEQNENDILNKLLPEYVSVYHIELNSGEYEIIQLVGNTNARSFVDEGKYVFGTFDEFAKVYEKKFIPEDEQEEFAEWFTCQNMKRRLQNTEKITWHYRSVSKEGKDRFYEAYAVKGHVDAGQFHVFLAFRNIDSILYKEKAIQKQLQDTLERVKLSNEIISSIARTYQYISRIDIPADHFEEINNRDLGYLKSQKSGKLSESNERVCRQYVAEEYQEAFLKFVDLKTLPERMKKEETLVLEYRMKDGDWHRLRFVEKKRDENGVLTHVLCLIRSISDTKKREHELMYQVEEAKKDAALKSRFLSNMSHDIRTPMNGIIGTLDLANRYPDDLEIQRKCREQIMTSSKYLVSIVNDILDMNKLESGDTVDQEIPFELTDLLNRINVTKQTQAAEKNIEYRVDWVTSFIRHAHLIGNPVYTERLLTTVCDNAVKFTKPGGYVRVWCAEKAVDGERVVYEFGCEDNGIGMSEGFVPHAFDMFSQENESSRSQYEGTGLGLAIAKKLAEHLNGTIALESRKGGGTTVIMTIPFRIGKPEEQKKKASCEEISIEGLQALVVEDNELNREITTFMLKSQGIRVDCAVDGQEAVVRFAESEPGHYDVILMDIMMPKLNGWDAARKIRSMKRPDAVNVPIIAMSANTFAEDIINSRISGMNGHLPKPMDEKQLLEALKECIMSRNHT